MRALYVHFVGAAERDRRQLGIEGLIVARDRRWVAAVPQLGAGARRDALGRRVHVLLARQLLRITGLVVTGRQVSPTLISENRFTSPTTCP